MRTTTGLSLVAAGEILAFAVTANTSFLNLHTAGYVLIFTGLLGLCVPRSGRQWLGTRLVRRTQWWPPDPSARAPQADTSAAGDQPVRAGLPAVPAGEPAPSGMVSSGMVEDVYEEE